MILFFHREHVSARSRRLPSHVEHAGKAQALSCTATPTGTHVVMAEAGGQDGKATQRGIATAAVGRKQSVGLHGRGCGRSGWTGGGASRGRRQRDDRERRSTRQASERVSGRTEGRVRRRE